MDEFCLMTSIHPVMRKKLLLTIGTISSQGIKLLRFEPVGIYRQVLEQLDAKNNLNTSIYMSIGSKAGKRADRPGAFLN